MNNLLTNKSFRMLGGLVVAVVASTAPLFAQDYGTMQPPADQTKYATPGGATQGGAAQGAQQGTAEGRGQGGRGGAAQTADPKQVAAFQAFQNAKDDNKKIQTGTDFITKYPKSPVAGDIAEQVVALEYKKQDWSGFYAASDKALAISPDDPRVLGLSSWVIASNFKPGQTDPSLDKAEQEGKHALDVLATMPKPATMTDEQFATGKALYASQAHSGLGLVYFREQKAQDAAAQLEQVASPDPTDIFALGASYDMMGRHGEANAQFTKCAAMSGPLQAPCQQGASETAKEK